MLLKYGCIRNHLDNNNNDLHLQKVSNLVDNNQEWNLGLLNSDFDRERVEKIKIIHPPRMYHSGDTCLWKGNSSGVFNISSAYNHVNIDNQDRGNDEV